MSVVKFQRLEWGKGIDLPSYQSAGAAGIDLHTANETSIPAGGMRRVSTGFNVKIPEPYVGFVCSRSGLAYKHRIAVLNAPGVIDSDYTGELFVMLFNHGEEAVTLQRNDRIAQLVVLPVLRASVKEMDAMPETARGGAGFGSTGGMPDLSGNEHHLTQNAQAALGRIRTAGRNAIDEGLREYSRLPKSRYPTPEEVEKIDADMAEFRRDFDCFGDKFMRLSPQEQEKVMEEAGLAFERLGPYGPVTPPRVNRVVESLNLTPEEAARILPQLEEAEAEALKDPKNQQLIADAMENQRQPFSIGHNGV